MQYLFMYTTVSGESGSGEFEEEQDKYTPDQLLKRIADGKYDLYPRKDELSYIRLRDTSNGHVHEWFAKKE